MQNILKLNIINNKIIVWYKYLKYYYNNGFQSLEQEHKIIRYLLKSFLAINNVT